MIVSYTYTCTVCGKPRTERYESVFQGVSTKDYRCADCYRKEQKIRKEALVSFICCKCGKESGKRHLKDFKLKDHKWTCTDCYRDEHTTLF
jgi:hypothetical protein